MRTRTGPILLAALVAVVAACNAAQSPAPSSAASAEPGSAAVSAPAASAPAVSDSTPAATSPAPSASAAGSAPGGAASTTDWPVYHGDAARTGVARQFPAFTGHLTMAWTAKLDGAVYGQPLGVGSRIFAATENDTVYALDPASGRVIWGRHVGEPVPLSTLPCGNIDPLGITSTAAYDAATGSLFVVAETAGPKHTLFALDASSGAVRWSRGLDQPGDDPHVYQQRGALALGNGYVYVGFGGLDGDCGAYRGFVAGVPTSGSSATNVYRVPVAREGAIWSTGGPAIDGAGNVYVSVGNGSSTTTYDGSDSVLKLTPQLGLASRFAPARWAADNAGDADLGSTSPALAGSWVFIDGKNGTGYVLRQADLGGIGGEVSSKPVCTAFGAAAVDGSTVFVPCKTGIQAIRIGADGSIVSVWGAKSRANGPPVVGGGAVWSVETDSGDLYTLSPASGDVLGKTSLGSVPHFVSPTLWNGLVLVGTMSGVTAVRPG